MQQLAAYRFHSQLDSESECMACYDSIIDKVHHWLQSKGAVIESGNSGGFRTLTKGGVGQFRNDKIESINGTVNEFLLEETTRHGQNFITKLSIIKAKSKIEVHAALAALNTKIIVAPIPIEANCPRIIREILSLQYNWKVGAHTTPTTRVHYSEDVQDGNDIVDWILSPSRALPIILVSEIEGDEFWDRFAEKTAHDLAGLAQVYRISPNVSSILWKRLGVHGKCHNGSIRLIWPNPTQFSSPEHLKSTYWPTHILFSPKYGESGESKFRKMLRQVILPTAATSIQPPVEINAIKLDHQKNTLSNLEAQAKQGREIFQFANEILEKNSELETKIEELQRQLSEETTKRQNIEAIYENAKSTYDKCISELQGSQAAPTISDDEIKRPAKGTVMFFKKVHDNGRFDIFEEVKDCNHNCWQPSHSADKARKGFTRRFGMNDWKNMQHCGTCTGGGMWRLQW